MTTSISTQRPIPPGTIWGLIVVITGLLDEACPHCGDKKVDPGTV
jgi:hypothetical protein